MESRFSEEALWASGLAARLKLLQANFADDDPATRQGFIVQEIEQALQGFVPEKRKRLLKQLEPHFPAFQAATSPASSAAAPEQAPETAGMLLDRFLGVLPELSAEERGKLLEGMRRGGLVPESGNGFALTPDLKKRLGLDNAKQFSQERAAKSLAMLFDLVLALDQFAWALWKQVAPKSLLRKEAEISKLAGSYLTGTAEVSVAQVSQALERTRKLIAGLLGAIGRVGATQARERAKILGPEAIEAVARVEKKWNESIEFACWRKYLQLHKEYGSEAAVERSYQEALAKETEVLWRGGRSIG